MIRASGGVIVRGEGAAREVVLVHRPAYDDWTIPKGKAHRGESDESCAVREVEEETGLRCELGEELEAVEYLDGLGRPKRARYWAMRVLGGRLAPTNEIDDARWIPLGEAEELLTYGRDVRVLRSLPGADGG